MYCTALFNYYSKIVNRMNHTKYFYVFLDLFSLTQYIVWNNKRVINESLIICSQTLFRCNKVLQYNVRITTSLKSCNFSLTTDVIFDTMISYNNDNL